jgi:putative membrane protein
VSRTTLPATASAIAVLTAGAVVLSSHGLGPQSAHMALHIALMNVAAPLGAVIIGRRLSGVGGGAVTLWAITVAQIVLLWMWHAPALARWAMASHGLQAIMHGSLFLAALFFWCSLLRLSGVARWHAIPALLLTGKLACLLSALLIFAPRPLYELPVHAASATNVAVLSAVADQQLAGLLMITACPMSYIIAGVIFAAQIIGKLGQISGTDTAPTFPTSRQ